VNRQKLITWLREKDVTRLDELWRRADAVRRENVGDAVHLRGLIEIGNVCVRRCAYCGLRAGNREAAKKYRMTAAEIMACAHEAVTYGYGTVVIQSGEDYAITAEWMSSLIRQIKAETPLAVTLSLGERSDDDLTGWRRAGADRYLLRFETSNRALYDRIHPPLHGKRSDRVAILGTLRELGYETGSGVMVGIPGQTYEMLADDIMAFRELDLDMVGLGPYISHPGTPLGRDEVTFRAADGEQVPATEEMTYKVLALTRLICPQSNIPSTTALATLNRDQGRELGLLRGANVVMPNLTPPQYRALYEIYPAKACIYETAQDCQGCIKRRILSIGREIGTGRGDCVKRRRSDVIACARV